MGQYSVVIEKSALEELKAHYQSGHKTFIKRIEKIILELSKHPELGAGNPKKLKFDLSAYLSRQINKKDRLIYRIEFDMLTVLLLKLKDIIQIKKALCRNLKVCVRDCSGNQFCFWAKLLKRKGTILNS